MKGITAMRRLFIAAAALVFIVLPGCGDGAGGSGSSGDTGAGAETPGGTGGGSSSSSGSGAGGGSGGASATCEAILNELRADLQGALLEQANGPGWPVEAADGFLFVSTDTKLNLVAGDHDNWGGTPMSQEASFNWLCTSAVKPGGRYKITDKSDWRADPWARSYTYDEFGEMSLIKPSVSHLDRYFSIGDSELEGRPVRVWVPEGGYSRVLYAHDGQNLFDPGAIWGGWHLQESAPTGILVVGIDNTPARIDEYTHNKDVIGGDELGGLGDAYADFLKETVRPLIQERYGEKGPIGVMGSSLGGLISLHIADRYPGEYAFAASLSGTLGWGSIGANNETMIERYAAKGHQSTVIYLDSGGGSGPCLDSDSDGISDDGDAGDNYCENVQMRDTLLSVGYTSGVDLTYYWEPDAEHNEVEWAKRVWRPLDEFEKL
jgi:hypothetical protein